MGRGLESTLSHRHTDGQQTHEKMLYITNHQGDANQNHNEIKLHTCQIGCYESTRIKGWPGGGEQGTTVHCW